MYLFKRKKKEQDIINLWDITDTILKIEDIVYDFSNNYDMKDFVCIKCKDFTCIYVSKEKMKDFINMDFYDKENLIINITKLLEYKLSSNITADISSKVTPQSVLLKELIICKLYNYIIYIEKMKILDGSDDLFKDLINLQLIKDKYNLGGPKNEDNKY